MSKLNVNRRGFLGGALAATAALSFPRTARAAAAPHQRKFLFFFANGGWDTTTVLDPHFGVEGVDMDIDAVPAELGKLQWTSGPDRQQVDRFFSRWGAHAAIVNGINVHSVGHDSARQQVMTGTSASSYPDWPTLLAANSPLEYPLPHLVFSGPAFPGSYGSTVVRAGGGTLLNLIDGSIVGQADQPAPLLPEPSDMMVDAFVHGRVSEFAATQKGAAKTRADALLSNLERSMELEGRRFEAGLSDMGRGMRDEAMAALELMRLGLTRCAMIRISGGWDTHGNNTPQAVQQDEFYGVLDELFDHMSRTPGNTTSWLIDEVVVVATSEIGRTPRLNPTGKDHWPFGSALVAGAGVKGNQVIGKTNDYLIGQNIDFSTGLMSETGDPFGCENLGVALLELGGVDPAQHLPGVQVLKPLLKG